MAPIDPVADNLQDLLRRKREMEKNKMKYHLTEADAGLLLTNANEFTFTNGQVIAKEGQQIVSVYRIKSGKVSLENEGKQVCELSQGWFLGETLLVNGKQKSFGGSLVAVGPVTLCELNINFVNRLFEVDHLLALKFFRHVATKLSSIFYGLVGHLLGPCYIGQIPQLLKSDPPQNSPAATSTSLSNSTSSTDSLPTMLTQSNILNMVPSMARCSNLPNSLLMELVNNGKRTSRRKSTATNLHLAFKQYALESNGKGHQVARLKGNRLKINSENFGFKHKATIQYSKVTNIVRTSERSVTIIYDPKQAKTLFFKTTEDTTEFLGVMQSLMENLATDKVKSNTGAPISSPPPIAAEPFPPLKSDMDEPADDLKATFQSISYKRELQKGEFLFQEGDLYQRIYSIVSGSIVLSASGVTLNTLSAGEVIGLPSILHLRPSPFTATANEETVVNIIPAYRLQEVINANVGLGARLYKRAADRLLKILGGVLERVREMQPSPTLSASSSPASSASASPASSTSASPASRVTFAAKV